MDNNVKLNRGGVEYDLILSPSEKKNWKLVNFCEFDKYAVKSYCAIHNVDENLNLGDITKVDETKIDDFNMIVGGSPCQDFSVAGKQKGSVWTCKDCGHEYNPLTVHWSKRGKCPNCDSENIEKTRSSLLVEYLRVVREKKPNFGIYENVKNIVGKQFRNTTFKLFEDELHEYGYNTYWKVLNSKDYGVPQNRERVYLIFIKKDLDNGKFVFPEGFDNGIRLKDVLEDEVDEKYYISDEKVQSFLKNLLENKALDDSTELRQLGYINDYNGDANRVYSDDCARTLKAEAGGGGAKTGLYVVDSGIDKSLNNTKILQIGRLNSSQDGVVVDRNGISPTHTSGHGNTPKILETPDTSYYKQPKQIVEPLNTETDGTCRTIKAQYAKTSLANYKRSGDMGATGVRKGIAIRKLTPRECFRLMGFDDIDYFAAKVGNKLEAKEILENYPHDGKRQMSEAERISRMSNSQLYKQAGNSIVVDVLYYIFVELYKAMPYLFDDLRLGSFFSGLGAFETGLDRLYESINTGNFINP